MWVGGTCSPNLFLLRKDLPWWEAHRGALTIMGQRRKSLRHMGQCPQYSVSML